jgi:hypothetical protein
MANPALANALTNSTRSVQKATYVPLSFNQQLPAEGGSDTLLKSAFVRHLNLQSGEVDAVQSNISPPGATAASRINIGPSVLTLLRQFESPALAIQLPAPSNLASMAAADLTTFGNALVTVRQQAVQRLQQPPAAAAPSATGSPASTTKDLATALTQLNTAIGAVGAFAANLNSGNVGMMNLERMEMTPAGVERGELIATIPLAPRERTAVVQKEWSVTSQEFTTIVTDSLENYSETGVTENTELSQATNSQVSHANQFNVTASASGGCGFVTGSATTSFGVQDQTSNSASDSRKHALQTTRKASSRVKQSHKVTISTTTVTGSSEATTRMLENASTADPIRIDYFSIMRKWYVALYRYGLRLTYDITVPEPGAAMRALYEQLAALQDQASSTFSFNVPYSAITETTYLQLASQWEAQVPSPPQPAGPLTIDSGPINIDANVGNVTIWTSSSISIPADQCVDHIDVSAYIGNNTGGPDDLGFRFVIVGYSKNENGFQAGNPSQAVINGVTLAGFLAGATGSLTITCTFRYANPATVTFVVYLKPTDDAIAQWQSSVWSALYNAAQTQFYAQQQSINAQITALQNQISAVDTLTLRREENDEIMKCALRWILGNSFEFMPASVIQAFVDEAGATPDTVMALLWGVNFTGDDSGVSYSDYSIIQQWESVINFINQAIEWENVSYFLYSYFWDVPTSWSNIRQIQHPDKTRQAFLRAGSARIVLTVRKGWEIPWAYFVLTGSTTLPSGPLPTTPYLTIAQQIQAYDNTNYPGIPPANPNGGGMIDDDTPQVGTTCTSTTNLPASPNAVLIPVADSTGFVVGASAIIDTWNSGIDPSTGRGPGGILGVGIQEVQTITAVMASPPSITISQLQYEHAIANGPLPIVQSGAKGVLIGEWFEYTPSSGTDIAVTSNLASIA